MDQVIEPQTGTLDTAELVKVPRYTLDSGEYFPENPDLLYPPGTVFYVQDAEGEFKQDGGVDLPTETVMPREVTKEFMIETATNFLREQGFHVLTAEMAAELHAEPKSPSKIEVGIMLGKLRSLVSGHMTSHAAINEANGVINKIEAQL